MVDVQGDVGDDGADGAGRGGGLSGIALRTRIEAGNAGWGLGHGHVCSVVWRWAD